MLKDVLKWAWQVTCKARSTEPTARPGAGGPGRPRLRGAGQTWETHKKDINNRNKTKQPEATMALQQAQRDRLRR